MKITEARMEIDGGNEAVYVDKDADMPQLPDWPYLAIGVVDFEEAKEIVETISRSRAQKKRKPAEQVPSPAPVTEKPTSPRGASQGDGSGQEVTPPKEAAAKARVIGEQLR